MISSIFGKTKPINFIILMGFLLVFYWTVQLGLYKMELITDSVISKSLALSVLLFSLFVVDFIVKKNKITLPNSYAMLYYVLLMVVFPETLTDNNAILFSLFILMAIRRMLSIKSLKDIKIKIFDATLWILVSSIFYNWGIIYLILVFVSIYIYDSKNIRSWLVVFAATCSFFLILYAFLIFIDQPNFILSNYNYKFDYNVLNVLNGSSGLKILIYTIINIVFVAIGFLKIGKIGVDKITTLRLISLSLLLGLMVNLLSTPGTNHAIIITFFPSVIFITNYLESIKRNNIKEVVLTVSVLVPLAVFISKLLIS